MSSYTQPAGQKGLDKIRDYDRRIRTLEFRQGLVLPDNTIPGTPSFLTPLTAFYQSPSDGSTRAQITLNWTTPDNTDGSQVLDAAYYEVQYRPAEVTTNQPTYAELASEGETYSQLNADGDTYVTMPKPDTPPAGSDWHSIVVPWNNGNTTTVKELTPGVPYEFRIRFADTATPTNLSAWSSTLTITAAADTLAPSQPAAPTVASSLIAVQVEHQLGKTSGGTFNLEADLHHLEVHASYEPAFIPDASTLLGKLIANAGMLTANIPALGSFGVSSTVGVYVKVIAVDQAGNKSSPSAAASATATLINSEHISDLSADKITAGTITAGILLAGSISTGVSGARAVMDTLGIRLYDAAGSNTVNLSASDGSATLNLGTSGNFTATFSDGSQTRIYAGLFNGGNILDSNGSWITIRPATTPGHTWNPGVFGSSVDTSSNPHLLIEGPSDQAQPIDSAIIDLWQDSTTGKSQVDIAADTVELSAVTIAIPGTSGSGVFVFEGDTNLYRSAANVLTTDDSLTVGSNLAVGGSGSYGGSVGVLSLANAAVVGGGNPSGGGILYSSASSPFWLDDDGLITSMLAGGGSPTPLQTGTLAESVPRWYATNNNVEPTGTTTGSVECLHGIYLPAGVVISNISFIKGGTAAGTPTHWFFELLDKNLVVRGHTADQTTTALPASTLLTKALVTPYFTTYSGLYYIGVALTATTVGTWVGVANAVHTDLVGNTTSPRIGGRTAATVTAPGTDGSTTRSFSGNNYQPIYGYVS